MKLWRFYIEETDHQWLKDMSHTNKVSMAHILRLLIKIARQKDINKLLKK